MSFEQSKSFELTKEEEKYLNEFFKKFLSIYENSKIPRKYLLSRNVAEEVAKEIQTNSSEQNWFYGRAVSEACGSIEIFERKDGLHFKKVLPDRSVLEFDEKDLGEQLYNLGRFFFAKQFDHTYESLAGINKHWDELDKYVRERRRQLGIDRVTRRLPELDGMI